MLSGVSATNPFHTMHLVLPLTSQLPHPSYGVCAARDAVDVRWLFISQLHQERILHFWRAFTNSTRECREQDLAQRFQLAAIARFWWSGRWQNRHAQPPSIPILVPL